MYKDYNCTNLNFGPQRVDSLKQPSTTADSLPDSLTEPRVALNLSHFYQPMSSEENILDYALKLDPSCISILEQHLGQIFIQADAHKRTINTAQPLVLDVEKIVDSSLGRIKQFRKRIDLLRRTVYLKQQQRKRKRIKKHNIEMIRQQLLNLRKLRQKLGDMHQYDEIVPLLRKGKYVPYLCYRQLCLGRMARLMEKRINYVPIQKCRYEWPIENVGVLCACVIRILTIEDRNLHNMKELCRRYVQLLAHFRLKPKDQQFIQEELGQIFKQKLLEQTLVKDHHLLTKSLSIMQFNDHTIELFTTFCSLLRQERNRSFGKAFKQLKMLEKLEEQDLRTWLKLYEFRYGWLSSKGIEEQLQQVRILVTKKIFRPLMLDQNFASVYQSVDNYHDRKHHQYRLFSNCKELFHLVHPAEKISVKDPWVPFVMDRNRSYRDKKIDKIKKDMEFTIFPGSHINELEQGNFLEYLKYGQILHFLWGQSFHNSEVMHIWAVMVSQNIFRTEPSQILHIGETQHFLTEQIKANYHVLAINSSKQAQILEQCKMISKLSMSQDKKQLAQAEAIYDRAYNYLSKNKISAWKKRSIDQIAQKIDPKMDCMNEIAKIRRQGINQFFRGCKTCENDI